MGGMTINPLVHATPARKTKAAALWVNCTNQRDNCLHFDRANIQQLNQQNQQLAPKLASINIIGLCEI